MRFHRGFWVRVDTEVVFHLVRYVETRGVRGMSEEGRQIEESTVAWAKPRLNALAAKAGQMASRPCLRAPENMSTRARGD